MCAEDVEPELDDDPVVHAISERGDEDAWRASAVEIGPERRQDVIGPGRVWTAWQVAAVIVPSATPADYEVAVRVDPDGRPRLAGVLEGGDGEVEDLLVANRDRGDAECVQWYVPGQRAWGHGGHHARGRAFSGH
jgi:hypothetical protein